MNKGGFVLFSFFFLAAVCLLAEGLGVKYFNIINVVIYALAFMAAILIAFKNAFRYTFGSILGKFSFFMGLGFYFLLLGDMVRLLISLFSSHEQTFPLYSLFYVLGLLCLIGCLLLFIYFILRASKQEDKLRRIFINIIIVIFIALFIAVLMAFLNFLYLFSIFAIEFILIYLFLISFAYTNIHLTKGKLGEPLLYFTAAFFALLVAVIFFFIYADEYIQGLFPYRFIDLIIMLFPLFSVLGFHRLVAVYNKIIKTPAEHFDRFEIEV